MRRRLINLLRLLALVSFVGAAILWPRSYSHADAVAFGGPRRTAIFCVGRGMLQIVCHRESSISPSARHVTRRQYFVRIGFMTERLGDLEDMDFALSTMTFTPRWEFAGVSLRSSDNSRGDISRAVVVPMWLVTLALLPVPLVAATRIVRTRRRRKLGRCARCGYDLRGSRDSGRCPECGSPAPQGAAPSGAP